MQSEQGVSGVGSGKNVRCSDRALSEAARSGRCWSAIISYRLATYKITIRSNFVRLKSSLWFCWRLGVILSVWDPVTSNVYQSFKSQMRWKSKLNNCGAARQLRETSSADLKHPKS